MIILQRSIRLTDELAERLKSLAEKKGLRFSSVIQMACKEFADREEELIKKEERR